ncbi:DUF4382 domain-containing protein [Seonamhaeicola aphaedonensis]|uniref:Uncharacterized protein DUF4382 n=1 Tax=Seonamhaeicola aphaedonensis TaxID=1461338 RepID=A0A3D9HGX4_9FLAO|nr:DUF4382 domain-containing protein [Seonamhaeicola aphaedonensis]RED48749.1 uncharacterized protein DUF4382 [Seonamhaeicola aphaedonensis]
MNILNKLRLILPLLFLSFLISCNDSESSEINKEAPTISIRLVDNPGDYEAVNVEIIDVMIRMEDESGDDNSEDTEDESGWMSLEAESGIVNLLDFTGGFSKVLVERFPIPVGTLSQIRLVLGNGNTIVIEGENNQSETFDLKTPSGQQSGLKVKVNAVIEEGFTYDFILDFDVEKSIVHAGNSGNIILKPVIYASAEASSGIIEGSVSAAIKPGEDSSPNVPAIAKVLVSDPDGDYEISAFTDDNGAFALWGVPGGTYDVMISPADEEGDYNGTSASGVVVINGEITSLTEPIVLPLKPGAITGKVLNELAEGVTVTGSIMVNGSAVTDNVDENGIFLIENVPPGVYTVTITPSEGSGLTEVLQNNIQINPDETTDLGGITLPSS